MFDICLNIENIHISSIEKEDIVNIQQWINSKDNNSEKPLAFKEFYQRFLEYYVSENEFFLKILKNDILIGVLKGRMEFKSTNEVWLWYFLIDENYRELGMGSLIVSNMISYFKNELGIHSIYTCVCEKDMGILKFWNQNNFKLLRISKDFFNSSEGKMDMLILRNNS